MGTCTSTKTHKFDDIDRPNMRLVISRPVIVLRIYQNTNVDFSNAYQLRLTRDLIGLQKFAKKVDPYMHYRGKSLRKKKKLQNLRRMRSEDEQLLLAKLWIIYLLAQRFTTWGQLSRIHNKDMVSNTIQLFIQTYVEMMVILERMS